MSRTSINLSDRLFFTVNYNNGTARFGLLEGKQEILVNLSNTELIELCEFIISHEILSDISEEKEN